MKVYSKGEFQKSNTLAIPKLPEYTFYPKDLPSKGLFYSNQFLVKVKPYTFGDIEYISQSDLPLRDIIKFILQGITTELEEPENLTFFDFLFLSLVRKLISFGAEKYKIEVSCSKCGKKLTKTFTLEDLEFKDIEVDSYKPLTIEYRGFRFILDVLRVKRVLEVSSNKKELSPLEVLALHITSLSFNDAKEFLKNLIENDFKEFEQIVRKYFYHDLKPLVLRCSCGHQIGIDLMTEVDLIKPFRESRESSAFKILDS
jgi:hypothetical protein